MTRRMKAAELEAEAKKLRRQEKAFWDEIRERLDEVKEKFDLEEKSAAKEDTFSRICQTYGEDNKKALYDHLTSQPQIDYYWRRKRG